MEIMGVVAFVVYALAVARATGLITTDAITAPIRDSIIRRLDGTGLNLSSADLLEALQDERHYARWALGKLITCPWCASIWVAAAITPLWLYYGDTPWYIAPALGLAASQITGMLSNLGRD